GEEENDKQMSAKKETASALALASASTTLPRWLLVERPETGSPAQQSGLQPGDILVSANKVPITCRLELERSLLDHAAGESVALVVRRKGTEKQLDLVLQSYQVQKPVIAANTDLIWRKLGLALTAISSEQVARVNRQLHGGLAVNE